MKGFSREEMEAEMALRFLARANPPPILFRYRGPSNWAIDEIFRQQLYAAYPEELNDPFECCARTVNAGLIDIIPSGYNHVCARPSSGRAGQPAWRDVTEIPNDKRPRSC
jgi:hypothetical protein